MSFTHPILTCKESEQYEIDLLGGDGSKEWEAMTKAGCALGEAVLQDFQEIAPLPESPLILVLAGKGHNTGDALIASEKILQHCPKAQINIIFVFSGSKLRPLTQKCLDNLQRAGGDQVVRENWHDDKPPFNDPVTYDICIDGLIGMQFTPPMRSPADSVIDWVNEKTNIRLRAAVDLPSGLGDESAEIAFRADFSYATGIAKTPLFNSKNSKSVGRVRYLDIGFFDCDAKTDNSASILTVDVLNSLRGLREPITDKRSYGHLFVLGGSRSMPGAIQMSVVAALRSGAGLVTAFVPESVSASFAAVIPEAMWVPWPETPNGGLAAEGFHLLQKKLNRATALLAGPGMGTEEETQFLVQRVVKEISLPLALDADALQPKSIELAQERSNDWGRVVITPHQGEFKRISQSETVDTDQKTLIEFCRNHNLITLLKGPITRISDGTHFIYSTFGGPLLARGGSGDILCGLIGSMLAPPGVDPLEATCRAAVLHGVAADALARDRGHVAVQTTEILDYLAVVLRQ
jgi:hydroxyethylthiazole kinase-like uncharacterized protein yjeF